MSAQCLLLLMARIKGFDNDDQATNTSLLLPANNFGHLAGNSYVLQPGHHQQKFQFHQQQDALAAPILISHFLPCPFLDSWPQLFLH